MPVMVIVRLLAGMPKASPLWVARVVKRTRCRGHRTSGPHQLSPAVHGPDSVDGLRFGGGVAADNQDVGVVADRDPSLAVSNPADLRRDRGDRPQHLGG